MTTYIELEALLKQYEPGHEVLAEFYAVTDQPDKERAERTSILARRLAEGSWNWAVEYGEKHRLLSPIQLQEIRRKQCRVAMEKEMPWEALKVAREHHLPDLALEAAVHYSEDLLASHKNNPEPLLDIMRQERMHDHGFVKRALMYTFAVWVVDPEKSKDLRKLVGEFPGYFSAEETALVALLARAEELRAQARDRHYAQLIAKSRGGDAASNRNLVG